MNTTRTLPAISVHQPWAWAITNAQKSVENRSWATAYRGPIAIHATLKWDADGEHSPLVQAGWRDYIKTLPADNVPLPWLHRDSLWVTFGAVLAVADLVGCHQHTDPQVRCDFQGAPPCSPWAARGQWHWELANVRPLPKPVPCRGRQRIWRLPTEPVDVDAAVRAQLDLERAA